MRNLSIIVGFFGNHTILNEQSTLQQLMMNCAALPQKPELIIITAGEHWRQNLSIDGIDLVIKTKHLPPDALPAAIFNTGALLAETDYITFLYPGIDLCEWFPTISNLLDKCVQDNSLFGTTNRNIYTKKSVLQSHLPDSSDAINGYPLGWLEMLDLVPMNGTVLNRQFFYDLNGFSTCLFLQQGFWWEFCVRAARAGFPITEYPFAAPSTKWNWYEYHFFKTPPFNIDQIARRVVSYLPLNTSLQTEVDIKSTTLFLNNFAPEVQLHLLMKIAKLNPTIAQRIEQEFNTLPIEAPALAFKRKLRVTVLGGLWEPAHNQLCFFNYFSYLEKQGMLTWRTILDTHARPTDLLNSDIVIFSRVKSTNGCELLDFCNEFSIPTIYMLDDNWFSVANDWPEYKEMFGPESPILKAAVHCIKNATVTLVYNSLIAEDIRSFAKRIEIIPNNIDLSLFNLPKNEELPTKRTLVGYVGSSRKDAVAFSALSKLARERDDFDILLFGNHPPKDFEGISSERLTLKPYILDYKKYAAQICQMRPDILLAPLGDTRTDASKCPNKYLEISASGAAGIYTKMSPYTHCIQHEHTGLLVENTHENWYDGINSLLNNSVLQKSISYNAYNDIVQHYETSVVLSHFINVLEVVLNEKTSSQ